MKGIALGGKNLNLPPINMMIDSGTTFSHFPEAYISKILSELNNFCHKSKGLCGQIQNGIFKEDSCLELSFPDETYENET